MPQIDLSKPHLDVTRQEHARLREIYENRKTRAKLLKKPFSQELIAEMCGWSGQSAVSQYLTGRLTLNLEALLKLAKALEFDPAEVSPRLVEEMPTTYRYHVPKSSEGVAENASVLGYTARRLPVIGQASAGRLLEIFEEQDIEEWVTAPGPTGPRAFALRIEGISMEPKFVDSDKVIIDPDLEWKVGDYVFARKDDNTGTFKQLRKEGEDYYLCALNENFSPRYLRMDHDWIVVGKAKWKLEDL
ncbi:XRE family transcriptional regulator [Salinicola sp. CPA57]|uniref:LexA family protein n=1 Tax=Salinicola sp. CPA57 TaxID=1949080 RepID=UPI000DA21C44|nr:XRE family transcriptional regulator [Salinicola sp. CPA57]